MGFAGVHLLVLGVVPVVVLVGMVVGVYFLVRKAVAGGIRDGQRKAGARKKPASRD